MHAIRRTALRSCVLSAVIAIALLGAHRTAALGVELRWKFKPGETVRFETTMDMLQDMEIGGQQLNSKMSQVMEMTWQVKEAGEEQSIIDVTIDQVHFEMTPPGPGAKPIVYDSKNEAHEGPAQMMAPLFGAMTGQPMRLTVTPLGEVKDIQLPESMIEAMKKAGPGAADLLSEDAMKQTISRVVFAFPKSVDAGESWDSTFEMKNPILGKQIAVTTYTYAGPEKAEDRPVEKIDVAVHVSFDPSADAQATATVKEQASEGAIFFDNRQGLPLTTNMTSEMKIELAIAGQTIDQRMTTKVNMRQLPADAK